MTWKHFLRLVSVALFAIALSGVRAAGASTGNDAVPTIPCYKCEYNGVITNPQSACEMVDTSLFIDFGSTLCTTFGHEGGNTTCEESGEFCMWTNFISMTGTGLPAGGDRVVGDAEIDVRNCRGQILAWAENREAASDLELVRL